MNNLPRAILIIACVAFAGQASAQSSYKEMMKDMSFNFYDVCETADAYFETHDNGKGSGCGDGQCKKVTIAVFKSGKVIITGGRNKEQINESYRFITNFIESKKDIFCQKAVNREL